MVTSVHAMSIRPINGPSRRNDYQKAPEHRSVPDAYHQDDVGQFNRTAIQHKEEDP